MDFDELHQIIKERRNDTLLNDFQRLWLPRYVRHISSQEASKRGRWLQKGDVEDIQSKVVELLYEKIEHITPGNLLRGWICVTIRNVTCNLLKKKSPDLLSELNDFLEKPQEESRSVITDEQQDDLQKAMNELPVPQRKSLELRYKQQYTAKETAEILGVKDSSQVDQLCYRARKTLNRKLRVTFKNYMRNQI